MSTEVQAPRKSSHRPALHCFLACAAGIATARVLGADLRLEMVICTAILIGAGLCGLIFSLRFPTTSRVLGLLSIFSFGSLVLASSEYSAQHSVLNIATTISNGASLIYGRIVSEPESSTASTSFDLLTDSLTIDSIMLAVKEKIRVSITKKGTGRVLRQARIGERVKLFAAIDHLEDAKNPYEPDFDRVLKERDGIRARAHLRSEFDLYSTDSVAVLTATENATMFFRSLFVKANAIISGSIHDSLTKGFVSAVVLGDKTGLSPATLEDFQRAGLTHLLVVSGFNVSIVALLVYYLLRLVGLSFRRLRITLSMVIVLLYCLIVGLEPSVIRALIVIEFIFAARLLERKPDIGNLTAAAALVTIILRPYDLFDIGFQLSYGAVFALVFLYPTLEQVFLGAEKTGEKSWVRRWLRASAQGFFTSLSVFLGLLPVFLYHFHRVSIVGLAINVLGIPVAAIITVLGFLLVPLSLISQSIGVLYGDACFGLTKIIAGIAHLAGSMRWSVAQLPRPQTFLIILYLGTLFYIVRAQQKMQLVGRVVIVVSACFCLWTADIPFAYSLIREPGKTSLLVFDVGQGDAILLITPDQRSYLIDFGGLTRSYTPVADRSMLPLFQAEGIRELSGALITHMHIDHYGGAPSILENLSCKNLFTSGERARSSTASRLDSISQALHIPVTKVHQGEELKVGKDLSIYFLNPESFTDEVALPLSSQGMNHNSVALKIRYKGSSALLLGDIEASDEERLVGRYGNFLRSDIVKVAHHGSKTSSSERFVKEVRARYAAISVGKHNGFGHPATTVIKRWLRSGATVLCTDKEGALLFQSDGNAFERIIWK